MDRFGQTRPLLFFTPLYALTCYLLAFAPVSDAWIVVLSALIGLSAPPLNISIRPLWQDIVGAERVRLAYSVDTAYMNLIMLLGPVIASVVALGVSPTAALAVVGTSMLLGGTLLAVNIHSRAWVPEAREHGEQGLLRSPAMRLLALEGLTMGLATGFVLIGIPAAATVAGEEGLAGPVLSAMGVGAILGTVWAGAKAKDIAPAHGLRITSLLFALALLPLAFVPIGLPMIAVVLVAWLFMGPSHVFYFETIDIVRPRGAAVAALGALWMIEGAAGALGNAVGGWVAEGVSPHLTLALGSLFALASPIIFTIGIRTVLKPAADATAADAAQRATELDDA